MPNDCSNDLDIIVTDKEIAKAIVEQAKKQQLLEWIIPTPKKSTSKLIDEWYSWRLEHWGTKWDIYDVYHESIEKTDDGRYKVLLSFSTAWSPAIFAIAEFIRRFRNTEVHYYYYEPGCDFVGYWDGITDWCYKPSVIAQTIKESGQGLNDIQDELNARFNLVENEFDEDEDYE